MTNRGALAARDRLILLVITVVELVVFLDTTVLNVALPSIGADLGLDEAGLGWVTLGAAVVIPAQLALLATTFTGPAVRNRAFGVWSAMAAAGAAIGTAVGGPLTDLFGWPSIFLINLPVGVLALTFVRVLPPDPARSDRAAGRLDVPGAITGTAALLIIGYAIGALGDESTRALAAALLGTGLALLACFVLIEARSSHPLMPLRLFTIRQVSGSAVVNALVGAAHVPTFALLALYLQNTQHYSPTESGLAVLPVAVVNIVVSRTLIPYALDRLGAWRVLAAGLGLQALAMAWFARLPEHATYLIDVLPGTILLGIGLPAAFVGVTTPAVTSVGKADAGIAAGIVNTAQRVGSGLGVTTKPENPATAHD
ncbi:MFS transporter [Amycolatopsis taiwanensis]|uniref:MFS transporter n=1 Tax=Amycolatopsis taiwanensis TaxID=342230 RepID=UPI0025537B72|nr:MFS transporter [Amycolatopsis taiwanensis]